MGPAREKNILRTENKWCTLLFRWLGRSLSVLRIRSYKEWEQ
jgi:hypothetical protein